MSVGLINYLELNEKIVFSIPTFQLNRENFGIFSYILYSFELKNMDFIGILDY